MSLQCSNKLTVPNVVSFRSRVVTFRSGVVLLRSRVVLSRRETLMCSVTF